MTQIWTRFRGEIILTIAAIVWGIGFVFQRHAMSFIGPYLFSGLRFSLAALFLVAIRPRLAPSAKITTTEIRRGTLLGLLLAAGNALQQTGIVTTSAGKAGFITGLYMIFIPIFLLFIWKIKMSPTTALGVTVALSGLYLLSLTSDGLTLAAISSGDLAVLGCAVVYALHVIASSKLTADAEPLALSATQLGVASVISFIVAISLEPISPPLIKLSLVDIFYTGIFGAGIGFTLQLVGQKYCPPTSAGVIMSLESVFALLAGWIMLGEVMTSRQLMGCGLMLSGMIISQLGKSTEAAIEKVHN